MMSLDPDIENTAAEGSFSMEAALPVDCSQNGVKLVEKRGLSQTSLVSSKTKVEKTGNIPVTRWFSQITNVLNIPEHTPNKQSKVDLGKKQIPYHEVSAVGRDTQHASQYIDSQFQKETSRTRISDAYNIFYPASYPGYPNCMYEQNQDGNIPCTATKMQSGTSTYERFTDCSSFITPQTGPSTQFDASQAPMVHRMSSDSDMTYPTQNPVYPGSQLDPSFDQGYGSHSAGSTYHGVDSQMEGSVMEQESQQGPGSVAGTSADYWCGDNELEDLLYHFQNFFKNRFESELRHYQEAVYGILEEQQNHVRQIVHTAIREHNSQSYTDELLNENTDDGKNVSKEEIQPGSSDSQLCYMDYYIPAGVVASTTNSTSTKSKGEMKKTRLIELLAMSCSVSTLLAKSQYKSY